MRPCRRRQDSSTQAQALKSRLGYDAQTRLWTTHDDQLTTMNTPGAEHIATSLLFYHNVDIRGP